MNATARRWISPRAFSRYERLERVTADIGVVTAGLMQNGAGTFVIDLDASGTEPLIDHPNFEVRADGTAIFSGDLSAAGGTFSGTVAASSFTAGSPTFSGSITVQGGTGNTGLFLDTGSITIYDTGGSSIGEVSRTGNDIEVKSYFGHVIIDANDDVILRPGNVVDFDYFESGTSRTATGNYLPIKVNGSVRYLALYT